MGPLDGAEGGDGDTGGSGFIDGEDHLQPSLSLPSCEVVEPLEVTGGADMLDVRALVLVDDTLLAGALDGVYSVAKDGGAPPVKLGERGTTGDLAVLDGVAYTAQGVFLEAEVIPGLGNGATLDVEGLRGDTLLTADEALIISRRCGDELQVLGLDGTRATVSGTCIEAVAERDGMLYWIDSLEDTSQLRRAVVGTTETELLLEDTRLDGPLAVSSTSVYFGLSDGAVNSEYLARLPVGGGDVEVLAGPNGIDGIAVDDREGVHFKFAGVPDICAFRLDEADGTVEPIAYQGRVAAWDDDYYYAVSGYVGGRVIRIDR